MSPPRRGRCRRHSPLFETHCNRGSSKLKRAEHQHWRRVKRRREAARQAAYHLVLLAGAALFAAPFLWLVLTSLKPDNQIFARPAALPNPVMWSNYPKSLEFLEQALPVGTWHGL